MYKFIIVPIIIASLLFFGNANDATAKDTYTFGSKKGEKILTPENIASQRAENQIQAINKLAEKQDQTNQLLQKQNDLLTQQINLLQQKDPETGISTNELLKQFIEALKEQNKHLEEIVKK